MRRINHAIFRTAIAHLRDACLRPGTNAMLKRRQNGAAGKPSRLGIQEPDAGLDAY